ncbi:unnamed protein product [Amoebophrya sp. A25]|nr:unnamed protein product [Amoebophrya sp. A25]|eukprot:GSA25T00017150001.1
MSRFLSPEARKQRWVATPLAGKLGESEDAAERSLAELIRPVKRQLQLDEKDGNSNSVGGPGRGGEGNDRISPLKTLEKRDDPEPPLQQVGAPTGVSGASSSAATSSTSAAATGGTAKEPSVVKKKRNLDSWWKRQRALACDEAAKAEEEAAAKRHKSSSANATSSSHSSSSSSSAANHVVVTRVSKLKEDATSTSTIRDRTSSGCAFRNLPPWRKMHESEDATSTTRSTGGTKPMKRGAGDRSASNSGYRFTAASGKSGTSRRVSLDIEHAEGGEDAPVPPARLSALNLNYQGRSSLGRGGEDDPIGTTSRSAEHLQQEKRLSDLNLNYQGRSNTPRDTSRSNKQDKDDDSKQKQDKKAIIFIDKKTTREQEVAPGKSTTPSSSGKEQKQKEKRLSDLNYQGRSSLPVPEVDDCTFKNSRGRKARRVSADLLVDANNKTTTYTSRTTSGGRVKVEEEKNQKFNANKPAEQADEGTSTQVVPQKSLNEKVVTTTVAGEPTHKPTAEPTTLVEVEEPLEEPFQEHIFQNDDLETPLPAGAVVPVEEEGARSSTLKNKCKSPKPEPECGLGSLLFLSSSQLLGNMFSGRGVGQIGSISQFEEVVANHQLSSSNKNPGPRSSSNDPAATGPALVEELHEMPLTAIAQATTSSKDTNNGDGVKMGDSGNHHQEMQNRMSTSTLAEHQNILSGSSSSSNVEVIKPGLSNYLYNVPKASPTSAVKLPGNTPTKPAGSSTGLTTKPSRYTPTRLHNDLNKKSWATSIERLISSHRGNGFCQFQATFTTFIPPFMHENEQSLPSSLSVGNKPLPAGTQIKHVQTLSFEDWVAQKKLVEHMNKAFMQSAGIHVDANGAVKGTTLKVLLLPFGRSHMSHRSASSASSASNLFLGAEQNQQQALGGGNKENNADAATIPHQDASRASGSTNAELSTFDPQASASTSSAAGSSSTLLQPRPTAVVKLRDHSSSSSTSSLLEEVFGPRHRSSSTSVGGLLQTTAQQNNTSTQNPTKSSFFNRRSSAGPTGGGGGAQRGFGPFGSTFGARGPKTKSHPIGASHHGSTWDPRGARPGTTTSASKMNPNSRDPNGRASSPAELGMNPTRPASGKIDMSAGRNRDLYKLIFGENAAASGSRASTPTTSGNPTVLAASSSANANVATSAKEKTAGGLGSCGSAAVAGNIPVAASNIPVVSVASAVHEGGNANAGTTTMKEKVKATRPDESDGEHARLLAGAAETTKEADHSPVVLDSPISASTSVNTGTTSTSEEQQPPTTTTASSTMVPSVTSVAPPQLESVVVQLVQHQGATKEGSEGAENRVDEQKSSVGVPGAGKAEEQKPAAEASSTTVGTKDRSRSEVSLEKPATTTAVLKPLRSFLMAFKIAETGDKDNGQQQQNQEQLHPASFQRNEKWSSSKMIILKLLQKGEQLGLFQNGNKEADALHAIAKKLMEAE